ncbi:UNVERIFIED_CONTAM: hypothetical protein FKN15_018942 [Acipenser sinensis]
MANLSVSGDTVKIGDISFKLKSPTNPELVPFNYLSEALPQTVAQHLRWIMQKDLLGQDVFLIGPPGPLRRSIAMQYLELTKREAEYVALSRDTTETDLKQRREIRAGTAFYIDQATTHGRILVLEGLEKAERNVLPVLNNLLENREMQLEDGRFLMSAQRYDKLLQCAVRAATHGRILVLEGLEKAERNVLPVLNNLLENREMQLEDGRFLMSAQRYDKLLQDHTKEEMDVWKIVRVSEDFRVIALGLPVPRYTGNPLDPPLRSRFQARDIYYLPFKDHTKEEMDVWKIVRVSEDFRVIALGLPVPRYTGNPLDPPLRSRFQARDIYYLPFKDQLTLLYAAGPNVPAERVSQLLSFGTTLCSQESSNLGLPDFPVDSLPAAVHILEAFPMLSSQQLLQRLYPYDMLLAKEGRTAVEDALSRFELLDSGKRHFPRGIIKVEEKDGSQTPQAAVTKRFELLDSGKRHFPRGIIKVEEKDGSQTPQAAVTVQIASKEVTFQVPAGTRPLRSHLGGLNFIRTPSHDRLLAEMMQSHMVKDMCLIGGKDMTARDVLQQRYTLPNGDTAWRPSPLVTAAQEGKLVLLDGIHRVNLGTLSVLSRLIHDRELTLYDGTRLLRVDRYESLKEELQLSDEELQKRSIFPVHPSFRIIALAEPPVAGSSTQQWLGPELLTMFLFHSVKPLTVTEETQVIRAMIPNVPKDAVEQLLHLTHKLRKTNDPTAQSLASSLSTRQLLRICRRLSQYPEESISHAVNKACLSRFLPNLARSALQKNLLDSGIEDSSVVSNQEEKDTSCEIKDGTLKIGNVSVPVYNPDEKMKVPDILFYENTQHMMVMEDMLKDFLLGEHLLLVGNQGVGKNKIVDRFLQLMNRPREYLQLHRDTTVQTLTLQPSVRDGIIIYEDSPLVKAVKMGHILVIDEADKAPTNVTCILKTLVESGEMILADGRRIVAGDIFSCHAVDNPKPQSELAMLKQYGPDVPEPVLQKLVAAFGELRAMADQGTITYPYSTREVVNIVRHLQTFPDEGLANVVRNVFDFDSYNKETREILTGALHKHGIPIGAKPTSVHLAKELPLPECRLTGYWTTNQSGNPRCKLLCPTETRQTDVKGPVFLRVQGYPLERHEARALSFTEEQAHWQIPMNEVNIVCDVTTTTDTIYVATCNPVSLYAMHVSGDTVQCMDLYDVFPRTISGVWQPFVTVAALGSPLQGQVVLHEEQSNAVLHLDVMSGAVRRIILSPEGQETPKNPSSWWSNKQDQGAFKMCREFSQKNWLVFYKENQNHLDVLDVLEGRAHTISLPINLKSVFLVAEDRWLLVESKTNQKFLLTKPMHMGAEDTGICQLHTITEDPVSTGFGTTSGVELTVPYEVSRDQLPAENLGAALGQKIVSPNRVLADENNYAAIVIGFPDLMSPNEVYSWKRMSPLAKSSSAKTIFTEGRQSGAVKQTNCVSLLGANQLIRAVPAGDVPLKELYPKETKPIQTAGYLEVTDLNSKKIKYIPIPRSRTLSPYSSWLSKISHTDVLLASMGGRGVVTVDMGGLKEIHMSEYDASMYEKFSGAVKRQVQSLQVILDSLQAKGKERQWLKNQALGELDDAKIIDGLTGEKAIYKRRGELEPELGTPQQKPKRLRLLADVSGSMYRFNGLDSRLERSMEAVCMVMEALESYEHKFKYDIVGHSGDGFDIELVRCDKIPKNNKERLKVLKTMHAHSQFCMSGDYTLESTEHAVKEIAREEADEYFVIVLSDANLERYGISPDRFAQALTCNPQVNAFAVLIGSLGDQAVRLQRTLPAGRSFVAMDTKQIPQILQQIFTSTMLSSA